MTNFPISYTIHSMNHNKVHRHDGATPLTIGSVISDLVADGWLILDINPHYLDE